MLRNRISVRCAKSWQTPLPSRCASSPDEWTPVVPGHVIEFTVHPVGRGGDGLMRVVVLGDALSHPLDPLTGRGEVRGAEHLVEPVDHPVRRPGRPS